MNKLYLLIFGLLGYWTQVSATHIVGGEMSYECLGIDPVTNEGTYRITLNVYRDCFGGQAPYDDPAYITVYNGTSNNLYDVYPVFFTGPSNNIPLQTGNPCLIPPNNVCVESYQYATTVSLPFNANGYTIAYSRCCRNGTISNLQAPGQSGATFEIFLTAAGQQLCNSSPSFNAFPPPLVCRNEPLAFDHSGTDINGDQLNYYFCSPELGASQGNPYPTQATAPGNQQNVNFLAPYSATNPMGGTPQVSIDPVTGLISGTPNQFGQFVVGVCMEEVRNGVVLSITRRDFQFNVVNCIIAVTPTPRPDTSVTVNQGGQNVIEGRSCDNSVNFTYTLPSGTPANLIQGRRWTFWDANGFFFTATTATTTVQFPAPGLYNGRIVINPGFVGCTDSTSFLVRIFPPRVANYGITIDSCNNAAPIIFSDSSQAFGTGNFVAQYNWNIGGQTYTVANPQFLPPNAGTYNYRLTITDANGCTATRTSSSDWYPAANVAFTPDDPDGCEPHSVTFTNSSFPYVPSYTTSWSFGQGAVSSVYQPPIQNYPNPGLYDVSLTEISPWGCTSTLTQTELIEVYELPNANFNVSFDTCDLGPVTFVSTSTTNTAGDALSNWDWDFDDGGLSILPNPVHQFDSTQAGNYDVSLTVTDINGCSDTETRTVSWFPEPIIQVNFGASVGCVPFDVSFVNSSYPINGYTTFWQFGDGNTSNQASPTHTYTTHGVYNVLLIITSPNGICVDSFTTVITVNENPNAGFNFTYDTCAIAPVTFTNTATNNQAGVPIVSWFWDFGDGSTSTTPSNVYQFVNSGSFSVEQVVVDANGCSDSITQTVAWFPEPILAIGTLGSALCLGDSIQFVNNSFPINGYIFDWNFGDGNTSNLAAPAHLYATAGTYQVRLIMISPNGFCRDTSFVSVTINPLPTANFNFFVDNCNLVPVSFTSTSTPNSLGTPISTWYWDFDDGSDTTRFNPSTFTHLPSNSGDFQVNLTVTDLNGCTDDTTRLVQWYPQPLVSVDIEDLQACLGQSLLFQNNSYPITGYTTVWNFGDGTTSLQASPTHLYTAPGVYPVDLTITSPNGLCIATFEDTVVVFGNPTALFTGAAGCVLGPIPFRDSSIVNTAPYLAPINQWDWRFGDGNTSSLQNVTYQYANPGTYTIELVVTDTAGCSDSTDITIDWFPAPPIDIIVQNPAGCVPHTTGFTIDAGGFDISGYSFNWSFGNGTSANTQIPPNVTYTLPGLQIVNLVLSTPTGCTQTNVDSVRVYHLPAPNFGYNYDTCTLGEVIFTDSTQTIDGAISTWTWLFENSDTDTIQNPTYQYDTIGLYNVSLYITDSNGCQDSITLPVDWQPRPIYPVALEDVRGCIPFVLSFEDNVYPITGYSTIWDFGDGNGSLDATPADHTYPITGQYPVTLVVNAPYGGCTDTFGFEAFAQPLPQASFVYLPNVPSNLEPQVSFSDISIDAVDWTWDFGDGATSPLRNPVHVYQDTGLFEVELIVFNVYGCRDTAVRVLDVIPRFTYFLPNALTPNEDGVNDIFKGVGVLDKISTFNLTIWNRWGNLIYQTTNPNDAWNGRINNDGETVPAGVYVFTVEIVGGRGERYEERGTVTVVR